VSSKEADYDRSFMQKIVRGDLQVILIEQCETRSTITDLQGVSFGSRLLKLASGAMHRFDRLARRVERRTSGLEILSELVQAILKACHGLLLVSCGRDGETRDRASRT
jgi:hypothetical protein